MRTSNGSVVQFLYGEDGMDGTAIEAQKLDTLRMPPGKFRVRARGWPECLACLHTRCLWRCLPLRSGSSVSWSVKVL